MSQNDPAEMRRLLSDVAREAEGYVELRYHGKTSRSFTTEKGRLESSTVRRRSGVGVRVLDSGAFGFAATSDTDPAALKRAIDDARRSARASAAAKDTRIEGLAPAELARGDYSSEASTELEARSLEEKLELTRDIEAKARAASGKVDSASCTYNEILEDKAIVTSDGADVSFRVARPEFRVSAIAEASGERQSASRSVGVTGGWDCLFRADPAERLAEEAAESAVNLLAAKHAAGGRSKVILSPAIVGLLVHEAIGHTVEADFVESGSVAQGKVGQRVASDLVTLCDSGRSEFADGAGGTLPFDDEGVPTGRTVLIENGILKGYLHDRASAARFGVAPTGSARAWEYADTPLIRMRNTYIEPGQDELDAMIAGLDEGYVLEGPKNGQADATGEFMFAVERAWRVEKGQRKELLRGVTISGIAFDVMQTVDAVSSQFRWDLGSGYCGKGQPAKVDAGGPWVRCEVLVGGRS